MLKSLRSFTFPVQPISLRQLEPPRLQGLGLRRPWGPHFTVLKTHVGLPHAADHRDLCLRDGTELIRRFKDMAPSLPIRTYGMCGTESPFLLTCKPLLAQDLHLLAAFAAGVRQSRLSCSSNATCSFSLVAASHAPHPANETSRRAGRSIALGVRTSARAWPYMSKLPL